MIVRFAVSSDFDGIDACVAFAFDNTAEVKLIRRLRADNDVLFEYVAKLAGKVIGHVMVSELTLTPARDFNVEESRHCRCCRLSKRRGSVPS